MLTATSISPGAEEAAEKTATYFYTVIGIGAAVLLEGLFGWSCPDWRRFAIYIVLGMLAAAVHVSTPKLSGTFSFAFVLVLAGLFDLTYSESLMVVAAAGAVQCLHKRPFKAYAVEVLFNVAVVMVCIAACTVVVQTPMFAQRGANLVARFVLVTGLFFALNTALVSGMIAIAHGEPMRGVSKVWFASYWPIYLAGAGLAGLFVASGRLA